MRELPAAPDIHAHQPRYPPHTLAPDPAQLSLAFVPRAAQGPWPQGLKGGCPYCNLPHATRAAYERCRDDSRG